MVMLKKGSLSALVGLCCLQVASAGTDAFGVSAGSMANGCGEKCFCCSNPGAGAGAAGNYALCNMAPYPDCSAYGSCSSEVPLRALSFIPIGEPTLTHTQQQVAKTCCAGEEVQSAYAAPSEAYAAPSGAYAAPSQPAAAAKSAYRALSASSDVKCTTSTSVEASLHRTITWDTTYGDRIALSTETKIEGATMSGFQLTASSHSLMASGKTEIFAVQSPVSHPCSYDVPEGKFGTVESTSVLHSYKQRAEMRYQRCSEQNTMTVTLEYANQNTDNTCAYRESDTPCEGAPKLEEMVHWGPTSSTCSVSGSRVKRSISTLAQSELGNDNEHKSWNYEWDCKGRSIQQFDRRSKYNGVSFVWEPKVVSARAGKVDKMIMGLGTECPIDVENSGTYNSSNIEWFRFAFEFGPSQFRIVENGRYVCESHRDGVLVYPNQCNADYDPNHRFHDGKYDNMGCGYCYGGGRRVVDVCQNRNFGGFVTAETCQKKCDNWADCQGYAFGCENAGRCDCFIYPKRGVERCPAEQGENRLGFVLKKAPRADDIRTTNFCWMMSEWSTPGFCKRKAKSGAFYPLTYGDRFDITINDQDHIEYKQNGFLVYKSRYTAAYYLSRGTGNARKLNDYAPKTVVAAAPVAKQAYGQKAVVTQSYSDSAADLAMCTSTGYGYDSQNPKFFAAFSMMQGNDGVLHGWRVQDAYFTEKDQLKPIDLHLEATNEERQNGHSRNTGSTVVTATCAAVATAFFVTGLVVFVKRYRAKAAPTPVKDSQAPVLVSGLATL